MNIIYMNYKENPKYFTGERATKLPPPFPPYHGDEKYIFVSYAHNDSEIVFPFLKELYDKNMKIWYDEGLRAGENWFSFMKDKIFVCSGFLAFLSPGYISSPNAVKEIEYAFEKKKPIIAISTEVIALPLNFERIFADESVTIANLNESEKISNIIEKILNT